MSVATRMTAASLANSLGCRPWPPTTIQRRAPFTLAPMPRDEHESRGRPAPARRAGRPASDTTRSRPARAPTWRPGRAPTKTTWRPTEVEARAILEEGLRRRGAVGHHKAEEQQQHGDEQKSAALGDAGASGGATRLAGGAAARRRAPQAAPRRRRGATPARRRRAERRPVTPLRRPGRGASSLAPCPPDLWCSPGTSSPHLVRPPARKCSPRAM